MGFLSVVTLMLVGLSLCYADEDVGALRDEMKALEAQFVAVAARQSDDIAFMKHHIETLRTELSEARERSGRAEGGSAAAVEELRVNVQHLSALANESCNSQYIENQVKEAISTLLASGDHRRLGKSNIVLRQVQRDTQLLRTAAREFSTEIQRLKKELISIKYKLNATTEALNLVDHVRSAPTQHTQRYRHLRIMRRRISDMAKKQHQASAFQEGLQQQLTETQGQLALCSQLSEANVVSAKVDLLELENRIQKDQIANLTRGVSDLDKLHVSMLELLENVESVETKVDKTLPEYRKEISKLDVNMAQVNSQISYTREDQRNLRQSVKAIAFSVSNAIDKAVAEHNLLRAVNASVAALERLSKQHSYRLYDHIFKSEVNRTEKDEPMALPDLMGEVKDLQPAHNEYEQLVSHLPRDCSAVDGPPGTYLIAPASTPVDAWCSHGSTLLQRRFNGSVEFNVKFADYVHPIGHPDTEFWLGLENMYRLTSDNCSSMHIDMIDIYGGRWYANYEEFSVGSAATGYRLFVGGFTGNASDAFEYQNRMEFSAIDHDRDISNTNCAVNYEGGWWFSHCQHVNINGRYSLGLTWFDSVRNEWIAVASSEMTLYRRPNCA